MSSKNEVEWKKCIGKSIFTTALRKSFRSLDFQIGHAAGEMYTIFIFRPYAPPALGADLRPWTQKVKKHCKNRPI
jgi:hypothetical protein